MARGRARCSSSCVERSDRSKEPVRPVAGVKSATADERSHGRDPVRTGTRRVVLGSVDHLERLQTSRRRRKNSRWGLERLGFGEKIKTIKSSNCIVFWSIVCPQPAVTLYIYRVGSTYPASNSFADLNLLKTLITVSSWTGQTHRSDRSIPCWAGYSTRPVRPPGQTGQTGWCQFWLSTYTSLFFGKACLPKNIFLSQNCLRATISNASAIYYL